MTNVTIARNLLDGKICEHLDAGLLTEAIPVSQVDELLETYQMQEVRERKLNMRVMVYWLMALHLYPHLSQREVYARLVNGLRTVRDDVPEAIPAKSAFSYRREQLDSDLLEELFEQVRGPQAMEETQGAFYKGLRLLAIDGTVESVPDTEGNRIAFQYSTNDSLSHSPFPQLRLVLLIECATHLICDAQLSECRQGEATSARLLLERLSGEPVLLLWDSGFPASWTAFWTQARRGHGLGRLRSNVLTRPLYWLIDGSYLTQVWEDQDHHSGKPLWVRVIEYTCTDARVPGANVQTTRLMTTLLDPWLYPAEELIVLFQERWHAELVFREERTTMRLSARTLRSLTPQGILQEVYALLLTHIAVRTLMLRAAHTASVPPTRVSFKATLCLMDNALAPLGLVTPTRRATIVVGLLREIGQAQLPIQPVRFQARVVKRVRSRYERKKPEHWHVLPLEPDLDFSRIVALVPRPGREILLI